MSESESGRSVRRVEVAPGGMGEERRLRRAASVTLGLLLAAHTVMETSRDALFLANIPASRLPWVYIAVALLALGVARAVGRAASGRSLVRRLRLLQVLAAGSVLAFWVGTSMGGSWLYYALYVWSGVISGAVVVTFWMVLGDLFTITQGKRHFAGIAVGGALGALAGSGLATALAPIVAAESLLAVAALLFAASVPCGLLLRSAAPHPPVESSAPVADEEPGFGDGLRRIASHPYARRVALLVALASATLTFGDYLFKSVLAAEIPAADLSSWLARVYFGLNLCSIAMLLAGVTPFVRRQGIDRSLALMPGLLAVATLGIFAGTVVAAVVAMKIVDGTLRYSLHKTATELLYLPMDTDLRNQTKGAIDLVGGSAAKALASAAILGLVALDVSLAGTAVVLLALAVGWVWAALALRRPYLDVFRRTLAEGMIDTRIDFPEMDVASLESLVRGLGSQDENEVLASLGLLVERRRVEAIPSLILYHPSPRVVVKALQHFADAGRDDVLDYADRLIDHEFASVRAAAVRATTVLAPDRAKLEGLGAASCPSIRLSATAGLLANGWVDEERAADDFDEALGHAEPDTRMAIANAARLHYMPIYRRTLPRLALDPDIDVAREAVRAMRASGDELLTPILVRLLHERRIRDLVRAALLERGEIALQFLARALVDPATAPEVLRHIPRTIARFQTQRAADVLLDGLETVRAGMVRYKILRGLAKLSRGEDPPAIDRERLGAQLRSTVARASRLREYEKTLGDHIEEIGYGDHTGGPLLVDLLHDKRALTTGRIFLMLGLLHPQEDFESIHEALGDADPKARASAVELVEHLVDRELGRAILALVGDGAKRPAGPNGSREQAYHEALRALCGDPSEALKAFAYYHAAEIGIDPAIRAERESEREGAGLRERALEIIESLPGAVRAGREPAVAR